LVICHVPRDAQGLGIALSLTVDGRRYGRLTLNAVQPDHIVAGPQLGKAALERHHDFALLAASAELLGVMEGVSELTLEYLKIRKQFGRAIGSFQALQHRAVDNYILIESTRSLLYQTCERGEPLSSSIVSALKSYASGAALTVGKSSVQMHGGIGFTDEYDAGLYLKRAMWLSAHLGNETAHRRRFGVMAAAG
jgi:alkylation response protein AidB-like acyl-CoA dehydrogenase